MELKDIFIRARKLIEQPECWLQNMTANRERTAFCLMGAIGYVIDPVHFGSCDPLSQLEVAAEQVLLRIALVDRIADFNDRIGRTHAEVLQLLDQAIAACG